MKLDPRLFELSFYESCRSKVVSLFSKWEEVLSIYQMGHIGALGNSDIDFIFVVKDVDNIGRRISKELKEKFTALERYVVYQHNPVILTAPLMSKFSWIRNLENPILLYGKEIIFEEDPPKEYVTVYLLDRLIQSHPQKYFLAMGPRDEVQFVNGHKFQMAIGRKLGLECGSSSLDFFMKRNNDIRQNYRNESPESIHRHYIEARPEICRDSAHTKKQLLSLFKSDLPTKKEMPRLFGRRAFLNENTRIPFANYFFKKKILFAQPIEVLPIFLYPESLRGPYRWAAIKRKAVIDEYRSFLYGGAGGIGSYHPWYAAPMKRRIQRAVIETMAQVKTRKLLRSS